MASDNYYEEYARTALAKFETRSADERSLLFDLVKDSNPKRMMDLGCGGGQELLPFLENSDAECVGVDIGEGLGRVAVPWFAERGFADRARFVRASGELLPFADGSFDVILCRVVLPYMHNRRAIAEIARVLSPGGTLLLRTHAPGFFFGMLRERLTTFNPKQLAYPTICLALGTWHSLTRRQPQTGFWSGKEIFQTKNFIHKEMAKNGLKVMGESPGSNAKAPSYIIVKNK